jgi:hypothetical protein
MARDGLRVTLGADAYRALMGTVDRASVRIGGADFAG